MTTSPLGADQAEQIRAAARDLAAVDGIERTSAAREVLLDLAAALADLTVPVTALVEDHLDARDEDADYTREAHEAMAALTSAAAGLQHIAENH
ncbi:hypothetical protein [Streptomyces cucumeris]|uniref:hypothetical protein n=1 Tax=Streptomyces cucumeris TaxID=2962890 RepID=UPI003D7321BC